MLFRHLIRSVLPPDSALPGTQWHSFAMWPLSEHTSPAWRQKHTHPVNVICQVAQTDFHSCSAYADRAQQQIPRSLGLHTKDVLDPRTDPGSGFVAFLFPWRQGVIAAPFALDGFAKALLGETLQSIRRSAESAQTFLLVLPERSCSNTLLSCRATSVTA